MQYFIVTVLRNQIISGSLSHLLPYVLLWQSVKFFSYFTAPFRTTSYRLYQVKVGSVFLLQLVRLIIESVL